MSVSGVVRVSDDSVKVISHHCLGKSVLLYQEFRSSTRSGSVVVHVSIVRNRKHGVGPKHKGGQNNYLRFVECPEVVGVDIAQELSMLQVKCHCRQMAPLKHSKY